jgi:hypothetical protein
MVTPPTIWQAALQKGALGFWRHESIWWLGAPRGPPNWWTAFVRRCCMSHVTLFHLHSRLACRNQKSCLGAYGPRLISQCAMPDKPLPQQQALHPHSRAGLRWHGLCFYVFALPSIRCKPCCVPHSAPLKLLVLGSSFLPVSSVCSSQLVPYGACCLPLRAWDSYNSALGRTCHSCGRGVDWLTPHGLPAVEVFEVTSHLVRTYQTTDDPGRLLGPRSSVSVCHASTLLTRYGQTARRQAHRRFVVQALRHSAATRDAAGGRGCHRLRRLLRPVVARPVYPRMGTRGSSGALLSMAASGWCMPTQFLIPMPMWCCVPMGIVNGCGSMLSGSVRSLRLSALRCSAGWGGLCFSSGICGWWTRLLLSLG